MIDLYTKGVEQFGSERPEVRLGGLYALERLAEGSPDLREQVVDIVCAALKGVPEDGAGKRLEPAAVAIACHNFLHDHLAFESKYYLHKTHWDLGMVSLSQARLGQCSFTAIKVDTIHFRGTIFEEDADFVDADLRGVSFRGAHFTKDASFTGARMATAAFADARFEGEATFNDVSFVDRVDFTGAHFAQSPTFRGARVSVKEGVRAILPDGWRVDRPIADSEAWASIVRD